eukprot:Tamp_32142.p1 GENE.Tamp_32142~~Tamp_32142.p1  ORF type:complete len:182 (-),score=41.67 Tamp_32142:129-596(-)
MPEHLASPAQRPGGLGLLRMRGGGVNGVDGRYLHGGEDRDVVFVKKKPPPPRPPSAAKKADEDSAPMAMPNEVKQAIVKARSAKKMTQKQLAQAMNEQASVIQKYEQGRQVPTNAELAKMEKILGTKLPRIKKQTAKKDELEKGESHPSLRGGPA